MTAWQLIPMCHEWNMNANDVMMISFTLYANQVMSCLPCAMNMHEHGAHALCKTSTSK